VAGISPCVFEVVTLSGANGSRRESVAFPFCIPACPGCKFNPTEWAACRGET